jgi:Tol biopolymer transport system component
MSYDWLLARWAIIVSLGIAATLAAVSIPAGQGSNRAGHGWAIAFLRSPDTTPDRPHVMNIDGSAQRPTNVPGYPTYSPDGKRVAFAVENRVDFRGRLYVANADGSDRRAISRVTEPCLNPAWSPDGRKIVYTDGCYADNSEIVVATRDGRSRKVLTPPGYLPVEKDPVWSPDSRMILFTSVQKRGEGGFRLYLMTAAGRGRHPIPSGYPKASDARYDAHWSRDGKTIFFVGGYSGHSQGYAGHLYRMRVDGTAVRDLTPAAVDKIREFELSPHNSKIVLTGDTAKASGWEIYVMNADGTGLVKLTEAPPAATRPPISGSGNPAWNFEPQWSPTDAKIVFTSFRDGNAEIYVMNTDGSGQTNLTRNRASDTSPSWVPLIG